jgi:three-Cys-motif partner protein
MRQPAKRVFFKGVKEWSERKLQILMRYLAPAAKILGSWRCVIYLDGFAGRGIYEDGSKGSSVRAAELSEEYRSKGKPYAFRIINIEQDKRYFTNLKNNTKQFGNWVLNVHGTFMQNIDRIIQETNGCAVICFLDPFGIKGVDWVAVERLINRPDPTDLWIRFDPRTVRRLHGFFKSDSAGAYGKLATLSKVYGLGPSELNELLTGPTPEKRLEAAILLYVKRLEGAFATSPRRKGYVYTYTIKSVSGQPKGELVFATAHPKAIMLANDIIYEAERSYERDVRQYQAAQAMQPLLPGIEPTELEIVADKVCRLKQDILDILQECNGKELSRQNICIQLFKKGWFGEVKSAHINKALKELKASDRVEATGSISNDRTIFKFLPESEVR